MMMMMMMMMLMLTYVHDECILYMSALKQIMMEVNLTFECFCM